MARGSEFSSMPDGSERKKKSRRRWLPLLDSLNLTFCSSACSAVSVRLPPAAADAPTGGPAEAPAGGGPAPEGGCCISGGGKKRTKKKEAAASDEPAKRRCLFSLSAPAVLASQARGFEGFLSAVNGGLLAERQRASERDCERKKKCVFSFTSRLVREGVFSLPLHSLALDRRPSNDLENSALGPTRCLDINATKPQSGNLSSL